MRIAIGGVSHETNTFSSIPTDLAQFQRRTLLRGPALIQASRGVGNVLGGMVDTASDLGWQLVPLLFASATPSGKVRRGTFEMLANELVRGLSDARRDGPLDGVLLALHGAMVAEAIEDADGELLRRVRRAVGPETPVAVVFDFHANLTPAIVEYTDLILGFETYPHIDTYQRGCEAVRLLELLHLRVIQPVHALRQVPMLISLPAQWSAPSMPMGKLMRMALQLKQAPGIVNVVLAGGFPYSDIRDAGLAVVVTTDGNPELAARTADRIARAAWERREQFRPALTTLADAIQIARDGAPGSGPVVLADVADNPGAGGAGDGTAILAALLEARVEGAALAVITDLESVELAERIGAGNRGRFRLGGKIDRLHGPTLEVEARVRSIGEVAFTHRGPMGAGSRTRLGRTVVLEVGAAGRPPVEVIVCDHRLQVLDPELFRAVGIEPERRRVLVVKSSVHFRAAFEPLAGTIIAVDGPGLSAPDLTSFHYRRVRRPIWPLDEGTGM
ncbi:MAG TPA: M81 family metallopeptidase [Thermomicrobiales bacterium]|nr:M81 family metallopeptidase [Thermomicrobiales bacterium]